ncbi:MAG: hypothetical protein HY657_02280 [Acidobacteria bacterium]|nr:hypothetical protein [Acidobacteriota bacterium]
MGNAIRRAAYTVGFDGSEATIPETGVRVSLKRVDANTIERMAKGQQGEMETARWIVSPDRTMLTMTTEGVGPFGMKYRSTQVFERDTED